MTPEGRRSRAQKAAASSVKKRREAIRGRDKKIVAAFRYLSGQAKVKNEAIEAIAFLTECGFGVNLPEGVGVRRFLAQATGLTKRRVSMIVAQPGHE